MSPSILCEHYGLYYIRINLLTVRFLIDKRLEGGDCSTISA